ncbi:MAG: hypothetical protein NTY47_00415, partial [Candidatus Omnitrophica bacterium]|nr:hypothetical protein [Candidatus Omnitrophota bacterium]
VRLLVIGILLAVCACIFVINLASSFADDSNLSSGELVTKAWAAHGRKDIDATFKYTQQCIDIYGAEADQQQASLKTLPSYRKEIEAVQVLNDVGTSYFIQGESFRAQGKIPESIKAFKVVLEKYCYAQAWDQRGWFWQVAKTAKESILQLNPNEKITSPCPQTLAGDAQPKIKVSQLPTRIVLYDPGKEDFVNYEKYGEFQNVGTKDYKYVIKDQE